ncbi:hypothetical protein HYFRA_00007575 [Hymenoscyphus fraxineus]|uniref:Uncharacterized protein n=1 Tax=Hymenoscyphus fraxineus TaxID=746836 RepID=A0A9N9KTK6_9HELO|nr:hypothetical protein HYFRA_00007575 [Hymenoscyphus fraxineus]
MPARSSNNPSQTTSSMTTGSSDSKKPRDDSNSSMLSKYVYQSEGVTERLIQGKSIGMEEHLGRAARAIEGFEKAYEGRNR